MNHHEGREVKINIPAKLDQLLIEAREEMKIRTDEDLCDHDLIGLLIQRGIDSVLSVREDDRRLVGKLTVAELAELIGMSDVEEAKRLAVAERRNREEMHKKATDAMVDVRGIVEGQIGIVFAKTVEGVEEFAARMKRSIGPGRYIAALIAQVDETSGTKEYKPVVSVVH